jgi:hypothetical protein
MNNKELLDLVKTSSKILNGLNWIEREGYKEYCMMRFGGNYLFETFRWLVNGDRGLKVDGSRYDIRLKENYEIERVCKEDELIWNFRKKVFRGYNDNIFNFFNYEEDYSRYDNTFKEGYDWRKGGIVMDGWERYIGDVNKLILKYWIYDVEAGRVRLLKIKDSVLLIWFGEEKVMDDNKLKVIEGRLGGDNRTDLSNVYGSYLLDKDYDMRGRMLNYKYWKNEFGEGSKWILSDGEWKENGKGKIYYGFRILEELKEK